MSHDRSPEAAASPAGPGPLPPAVRSVDGPGVLTWVVPLLAVADLVLLPRWPLLAVLAIALVLLPRARRALPTLGGGLTLTLLLLPFAIRVHMTAEASAAKSAQERQRSAVERQVQQRWSTLVARIAALAEQATQIPEARSIPSDPQRLAALFASLDQLAARAPESERLPVALAIHSRSLIPLAWSGRVTDLAPLRVGLRPGSSVFVRTGSASTALLALAPISPAGGGEPAGYATAEVAVRGSAGRPGRRGDERDWLLDGANGAWILYRDVRQAAVSPRDATSATGALRGPNGEVVAILGVTPAGAEERERALWNRYRGLAGLLFVGFFLLESFRRPTPLRLSQGATALRVALGLLAVHAPAPLSATDWHQLELASLLAPLLASPLDLFLTSLWVTALSLALLARTLREDGGSRPLWGTILGDVLALGAAAATFAWVGFTVGRSPLSIEAPPLLPTSASGLLLHATLLLELIAGAGVVVSLLAHAHPRLRRGWPLLVRITAWLGLGCLAGHFWPRPALGLPLFPTVAFIVLAALAARRRDLAVFRWRNAATAGRVSGGVALVGLLALLVYPSLVHYSEKRLRRRIERAFAPMVLDQARWRGETLSRSCRQLDSLAPLERFPAEPVPAEELAFALWSLTDLAEFGFSSAIEVQGPAGEVVSRFGQNLAWLGTPLELPRSTVWEIAPARLTVGSATRAVLHASRLVRDRDHVLGALHIYVADDHWNLPFLTGRDPYSLVARGAPEADLGGLPVSLSCYDRDAAVHFSSAERPPPLTSALLARTRAQPGGFWTALPVDGQAQRVFLFQDSAGVCALGYPRVDATRFAANLLETTIALLLLAAVGLLPLMAVRAVLGRQTLLLSALYRKVRGTFSLRLTVTFVALAVVPVLALGVAVRGFVADRLRREAENQALERATVARKAVLDFALFQGDRPQPEQPVTDAALVWIASLVRNDLDLFTHGRLLASSKRELYASGLLAPRIRGSVYRALTLDHKPFVFHAERIGEFVHQVVSVPLRLDSDETGVLSVPLASRERETTAVLADLDRAIRLSLLLFVVCAVVLGHSMARRISDPISALTRATRRVAEGDLTPRVTPTSRDELRSLVEAFNRMAADLAAQRAELERTHRLAAFAEMARQVAHEVKNPLTPIQLSAEHLRRVFGDPAVDFRTTLEACTHTILKQVRTLRGIVTEFSAFGQPHPARLEPLDLAELVSDALRPYQAVLPPEVALSITVEPVPTIRGDRRLIERALVNLVENALQAVGSAGRIAVEVAARQERGRVQVVIADSGPGLAPEARSRLFEPFFSTKEGGTGLGLALVRKIVEEHGGEVHLESDPARGTRATLTLPAITPDDDSTRGTRPLDDQGGRS
jgi:signal transduction histidine kinase